MAEPLDLFAHGVTPRSYAARLTTPEKMTDKGTAERCCGPSVRAV